MSATTIDNSSAREKSQTGSRFSIWQIFVGALGMITVLAFIVWLVTAIMFSSRPFLGAMISPTMTVNAGRATDNIAWTGLAAGLQAGDQILSINGQALFADASDYAGAGARLNDILVNLPRTSDSFLPVEITFQRELGDASYAYCDAAGLCTLSIVPMFLPQVDFLSYFILPFVGGIVLLLLGALALRYKFNSSDGLLAATIAFLSAIYAGGIFDLGTQGFLAPVWLIGTTSLGASLASFGIVFPKRLKVIRNFKYLEHALFIIALAIGGFLAFRAIAPTDAYSNVRQWIPIASLVASLGLLSLWLASVWQRSVATTPSSRDQSNTVFIGTTVMIVPIVFWVFASLGDVEPFNLEILTLLFVFPNAAIVYAVLRYGIVDTDRIISQSTTYFIMIGALILAVFLLSLGGALLSIDLLRVTNPIMIAAIIFLMVLFFVPLRTWLQERIDAIYYRKRRDFTEKLETFNHSLTTLNNYDAIIKVFKETMDESLSPSSIFIFLREYAGGDFIAYKMNGSPTDVRFPASSPMIAYLKSKNEVVSLQAGEAWPHELRVDQPRLNLLKTQLLAGLMSSDALNGFILMGAPKAKESYQHEEVRFLENVAGQLAIATERSQVIETLERRVRELDVLSQVGQAVNFTIEFDDLLELIYNQASKLIPAPAFYIVLYEEKIQRLYFAFFLEDDDRYEDKEMQRWAVGNDLFSEIIKTNSAIRVNNFTEEMRKRGAKVDLLKDGLLAAMGVPLTAGRRILGAMLTAKRKDSSEYTQEQFKIFSDIGALAATSLDKANLFTQTKIRERQLTVLNDISRQLVATETDVEKLLQIIVTSAVEILNGEAGSLLLHTEDDTGDLSFRVVIGGGGDDLLGTRIPKGSGVVGKVVESGESIIVNDVESDPRHNVNVSEFISRSLLAVPLTSKNKVTGVLEVINKKDGTPFVDEDASLLTTFAGQAAVAIENARLFQQTDLQLSARVKELESLERLDSELNRTLELHAVAEITVRQAMNILNASAGALGIVHQNPPYLEIVAIKGYKREEYPKGAEGDDGLIWPLDEGIVKRVLRSRQADITMDVAIDPDYDSGLTNSNSQITLPMVSGDDVNAILILEKNTLPRFSLPDWGFAQRVAEHASIAIANAQFAFELNNANKSQSEFMGFAAHELKNPLTSVKGYLDVLGSGMTGALSEQQLTFVNVISSNVARMQVIIDDLRDAARLKAGEFKVEPEPMNIRGAVVETLRPFVRMLEEKNQELVNDVPQDLPLVWGDETRVIQVLTNLVSNAHKYSHENTTITLDGWIDKNYVDREGIKRGRMVVIAVRDQGIGMSEEDQKKLFKVGYFRSTNKEAFEMASGTGLGMMLTYNIMIQHKGEIWIESQLGKGSSFHVSFPLAEDMEKLIKGEPAAD